MKYTYRDFVTGRPRWTRAPFVGWFKDGLGIWRAVFARRHEDLLIPEYCLMKETKAALPSHKKEER